MTQFWLSKFWVDFESISSLFLVWFDSISTEFDLKKLEPLLLRTSVRKLSFWHAKTSIFQGLFTFIFATFGVFTPLNLAYFDWFFSILKIQNITQEVKHSIWKMSQYLSFPSFWDAHNCWHFSVLNRNAFQSHKSFGATFQGWINATSIVFVRNLMDL